ncbi:MAG: hypothetical protein KDD47_21820 [Acidobacteria bacterium]|nr:hypothetical protein [Acidobacteriota bacterium]
MSLFKPGRYCIIIKGTKIQQDGVTFEFYGKKRDATSVWVGLIVDGTDYSTQGAQIKGGPTWQYGMWPRWGLVGGTMSSEIGEDGIWYVIFDGWIDARDKPEWYDQRILTIEPGNESASG